MLSFIIPAYNEEAWIGRSISAIRDAMKSVGGAHEIIVAADSCTDNTVSIAQQHGARVIQVACHQISAARNAGAKEARGETLFFIDADTLVNASVIQSALRSLQEGAIGGGCIPQFQGKIPLWWRVVYPILVAGIRLLHLPGGSFLFCSRKAFDAIGGFSEAHYAAEDALFAMNLKRRGRLVVLPDRVTTSGRSLRAHSMWSILRVLTRLAFRGPNAFRDRRGLDLWYNPTRENPK